MSSALKCSNFGALHQEQVPRKHLRMLNTTTVTRLTRPSFHLFSLQPSCQTVMPAPRTTRLGRPSLAICRSRPTDFSRASTTCCYSRRRHILQIRELPGGLLVDSRPTPANRETLLAGTREPSRPTPANGGTLQKGTAAPSRPSPVNGARLFLPTPVSFQSLKKCRPP